MSWWSVNEFETVDVINSYVAIVNGLFFDNRLEVGSARPSNDLLWFYCIICSLNFIASKIGLVIFCGDYKQIRSNWGIRFIGCIRDIIFSCSVIIVESVLALLELVNFVLVLHCNCTLLLAIHYDSESRYIGHTLKCNDVEHWMTVKVRLIGNSSYSPILLNALFPPLVTTVGLSSSKHPRMFLNISGFLLTIVV